MFEPYGVGNVIICSSFLLLLLTSILTISVQRNITCYQPPFTSKQFHTKNLPENDLMSALWRILLSFLQDFQYGVTRSFIFPANLTISAQQTKPGPEIINFFSCSTQLTMKFALLINLKLLIYCKFLLAKHSWTANSYLLNIAERENISDNKYENANYCWHFHIY